MPEKVNLSQKLNHIQTEGGSIAYIFENGSRQVQEINKSVFFNEKGRKRDAKEILEIFQTIGHDLGAVSIEF